MSLKPTGKYAAAFLLLAGLIAVGYVTRDTWQPWLSLATSAGTDDDKHDDHAVMGETQQVKLSPQAQANLRLVVKPLQVERYWRTIQVPGLVVDRPGQCDRSIVSPMNGVVARVHHFPGDMVQPGDALFTVRLLSESMHLAQAELFKSTEELKIVQERHKQLANVAGAVPSASLVEIDNQLRRLAVAIQVHRNELQARGLTAEQIDGVAQGKFVTEVEVRAPAHTAESHTDVVRAAAPHPTDAVAHFSEIQELKVELGQQVQTGQTMCVLSNHQLLYIEGRAFKQEAPLLEKAAQERWPIRVEFMEEEKSTWPILEQTFTIRHIANTIDTSSRTIAFYIPLFNQSRSFQQGDRALVQWQFRIGQKVRLHVNVEKLDNVFILPADAVVREGPEAYVFRQNGELFERKPVNVLAQDRLHAVIANDGSVPAGLFVAHNGAAQMNRVLKSGTGGLPPGFHMHADGSIHSNAAHK